MDNYIYIAKERVENLYGTLGEPVQHNETEEISVNLHFVTGSHKNENRNEVSIQQKLQHVLNAIEVNEDYSDGSLYLKGRLPMSWNAQNRIEGYLSSTFWIGEIEKSNNNPNIIPYDKTLLLLIGSDYNIVGNSAKAGKYYSTSYISAFFDSFERDLDPSTYKLDDYRANQRADEDYQKYLRMRELKENSPLGPEPFMHFLKGHFSSEWHVARYVYYLSEYYRGNLCEYEFVAQRLYSSLFVPDVNEDKKIRCIVAAPLYVKRTRIIGQRTLITPQERKYVLTKAEYKAHKNKEFLSLSQLLRDEGLQEEAVDLDLKLREIWVPLRELSSTERNKRFLEKAEPIVEKYFYIIK